MNQVRFTNKHDVPEEVVRAIMRNRYTNEDERESDYSVSQVASPCQMITLLESFPDEAIVRDVLHYLPAFYGSIAHEILAQAWREGSETIVETRIYMNVAGKIISGKPDSYLKPQIRDYKTTKAYKIQKGDYRDWEMQLNLYAQLCVENGHPVESIVIHAFILNFMKNMTYHANYPQMPYKRLDLELWPEEVRAKTMKDRVLDLVNAKGMTPEKLAELYPCSKQDMWQDLKDYAIMKPGADRAWRTFNSLEAAEDYFKTNNVDPSKYEVVVRMEPRRRCLDWCDAALVCVQNRRLCEEEGINFEEHYAEYLEADPASYQVLD